MTMFGVALKPLLYKTSILSDGIAAEHHIIFSLPLCACLSLPLFPPSVPLHLSASPLLALFSPLGISSEHPPLFFHQGYEREGGGKTDE